MRVSALLTIALALALSACSSEADVERVDSTAPVVQMGAPGGENRTLSVEEARALDLSVEHSEADVAFTRHMLAHHEQAIIMTDLVEERTDNESIRLLAERMSVSQDDEIDQMEGWLISRGETVLDPGEGHAGHPQAEAMPGMLTAEQLAELEASTGQDFDRLFLEYMIMHHEGAITMVQDLWAAEGGQEVQIGDIARHVESDQRIEIARMRALQEEIG